MTTMDKEKNLSYVNIALAAALIIVVAIILKPLFCANKTSPVAGVGPQKTAENPMRPLEVVYDIDKIKSEELEAQAPQKEPADLKEMYETSTKKDVGENIVEAWKAVPPEDKEKFTTGLDKEIADLHEQLKSNKYDRKTRSFLFISESLKKLAADGFNYKVKKTSSPSQ